MQKLYKFHWDCGRNGDVEGIFIEDEEVVKKYIGKHVYLGEALGKHSDVNGTLDEGDIKVLTDDQEFINKCSEYGIGRMGYKPIHYIMDAEADGRYDDDE